MKLFYEWGEKEEFVGLNHSINMTPAINWQMYTGMFYQEVTELANWMKYSSKKTSAR